MSLLDAERDLDVVGRGSAVVRAPAWRRVQGAGGPFSRRACSRSPWRDTSKTAAGAPSGAGTVTVRVAPSPSW
ncbi:hypothetical protein [Nonomuraea rubra]|uniref:hypothetical protein n=1 Tax=Nonomuraea rubra TaxID=46180 RepID=UPI0031E99D3F